VTSPHGRWLEFTYDGSDRITEVTDNLGRTVTYTYDANGNLETVTDPEDQVTTYTYDTSHRMLTITDGRDITYLTNTYVNGRVESQTLADPQATYEIAYTTDGSGNIRPQIREALALLKEAGWEIRGEKLVNGKTGEPMVFEILLWNSSDERVVLPVQKNLQRMGITMNVRLVDTAQFQSRWTKGDFDMVSGAYEASFYPSPDLKIIWRSDYIESTYNQARVQDPAIDSLVDGIVASQNNEQALLAWGRAFDRVLQWNFYVIPEWHLGKYRIAWWNKFSRPPLKPKYSLGTGSWWADAAKEAKLPKK
jgi:YD repeat-containing protein